MYGLIRIIIVFGITLVIPFIILRIIKIKNDRLFFTITSACIVATYIFILSMMFVKTNKVTISLIMFILFLLSGIPTQYLLYPKLLKNKNIFKN
jgi:hypothetical protein